MLHRFITVISGGEVPLGVLDEGNATANPKTGSDREPRASADMLAGNAFAVTAGRKEDSEPDNDGKIE
jgi:hypothetical protein